MDLTPNNIRNLRNDLHGDFLRAFQATSVIYPDLVTTIPSNSARNDYIWSILSPQMREWIGSRVVQNLGAQAYALENKTWESTLGVRVEDIEDDNLGNYANLAAQFGEAARLHPDELLLDLLKNGQSRLCFDNQFFFDVDHPVNGVDASGGVYSNYYTGRALTPANYEIVRAQARGIKGPGGRSLRINMDLLVVPPALEVTARRIVEIQNDAAGAGNPNFGTARVLVLDDLAGDDTTWYLLTTGRVLKPFIFQTRRPLKFVTKNAITDEVVLIENEVRFYADARYNMGYSLPWLALKAVA